MHIVFLIEQHAFKTEALGIFIEVAGMERAAVAEAKVVAAETVFGDFFIFTVFFKAVLPDIFKVVFSYISFGEVVPALDVETAYDIARRRDARGVNARVAEKIPVADGPFELFAEVVAASVAGGQREVVSMLFYKRKHRFIIVRAEI